MMKMAIAAISVAALTMAYGAHAALVPACGDNDSSDDLVSLYGDDLASHRMFELKPIVFAQGDNASYQLNLTILVKADGTPKCVQLPQDDDSGPYPVHYPDDAIRAAVSSWRYEPYHDNGKAIPFSVSETIFVTHASVEPAAMPKGMPADTIAMERTDCFGTCPAYKVTIHRDGRVDYAGTEYVGVSSDLSYKVAPADAAALFDQLRENSVWSAQDAYVGAETDSSTTLLTLSIGGQTKTIRDYLGTDAGIPDGVTDAENAIDTLAGTDRWIHITQDSLADLDAQHFDYAGAPGAALLINVITDEQSDDAVVQALLDRHVSLDGAAAWDTPDMVKLPLDAALESGRSAVVPALLKAGVLLKDGKPDQERINSAFVLAVENNNIESARLLGAMHPALTYPYSYTDYDTDPATDKTAEVSDLFLIDPDSDRALEMYQYLLSLGADPKALDHNDSTVLEKLVNDPEIAKSLIGLGVNVNAKDKDGSCALLEVTNEESALILLNAGADPSVQNDFGDNIFTQADFYDWPDVKAWLKAHKLKAPPPAT